MRRVDKIKELSGKYPTCFKPTANSTIARRFFLSSLYIKDLMREKHRDTTISSMMIAYIIGHTLCEYRLAKGHYIVESNYHNDIAFYNGLWDLACEELAGMHLPPPVIPAPADVKPTVFRLLGAVRICDFLTKKRGLPTKSVYAILRDLNFVRRPSDNVMSGGWIDKNRQLTKDALIQFVIMSRKMEQINYVAPYQHFWSIQSDMAWMNFLCTVRPTIREAIKKALQE